MYYQTTSEQFRELHEFTDVMAHNNFQGSPSGSNSIYEMENQYCCSVKRMDNISEN